MCQTLHYKKLENNGGWIEYASAFITAAKYLAAIITAIVYSIQPLPLSNFVVVSACEIE
jgi:hypothetical protein